MSITAFYAVCILSIDFLIYFFFKLVYGEKRRAKPRRLPPEYYNASSTHLFPAKKKRPTRTKNIVFLPSRPQLSGATARVEQRNAATLPGNSAEMLAHRRIVSSFAQGPSRKAS